MRKIFLFLGVAFCLNTRAQCSLTVTAVGNTTICSGACATFTANGAVSYTWATPIYSSYSNGTNTISACTPGGYTVTGTTGTCTATHTFTIIANPLPVIDTTGVSITPTGCANPTGVINHVTITGASAISYSWTNMQSNNVVGTGSGTNASVLNITAGLYCINVVDGNGCVANFCSISVTNPNAPAAPMLAAGNDTAYCWTDTIKPLIVNAAGDSTIWYANASLTNILATNTNTYTPSGLSAGTSTLYVTATANGCTSTAKPITISIDPQQVMYVTTTSVTCNGQNTGTATVVAGGGSSNYTYVWSTYGSMPPIANYIHAGTYTVVATDAVGCKDSAVVQINQPTAPLTVTITETDANDCISTTGSATATCTGGTLPYQYVWMTTPQQYNAVVSNIVAGTYSLMVVDANSCRTDDVTTIGHPATPTVSFTITQDTVPHSWNIYPNYTDSTLYTSYSWDWGDGSPPSTTAFPTHTYSTSGYYTICLTVADTNGCSANYCNSHGIFRSGNNSTSSSAIYMQVINNNATGIKTINTTNHLNIYPNPAQSNFTIETNVTEKQMVFIFDVNGKLVYNQFIYGKTTIDAGNLNAGVYSLSITGNQGSVIKKLVVVK